MCIFRSEFSAVDNNETFGRNVSFNDTFISSFQKLKSQKDLNSLRTQENPQASGFALLVSSSVEGRRKFFLVLADQLLSRKVYSANKAMDSSNMCLNGTIRYAKSFENRYRLVNKH